MTGMAIPPLVPQKHSTVPFVSSIEATKALILIELLAGAFTGAAMEDKGSSNNRGSLVIVINPDYVFGLNTLEDFRSSAMTMCDRVKNAKKYQLMMLVIAILMIVAVRMIV